jgi:hypothetical protein
VEPVAAGAWGLEPASSPGADPSISSPGRLVDPPADSGAAPAPGVGPEASLSRVFPELLAHATKVEAMLNAASDRNCMRHGSRSSWWGLDEEIFAR